MIEDVVSSLKFISSRSNDFKFLDVANLYLFAYNKLYSREAYKQGKFSLSIPDDHYVKFESLRLTGRFIRRFGGYKGDDVSGVVSYD